MNGCTQTIQSWKQLGCGFTPKALLALGLDEGSEVSVELAPEKMAVVIRPVGSNLANIAGTFALQVNELIQQYRSALEALAR